MSPKAKWNCWVIGLGALTVVLIGVQPLVLVCLLPLVLWGVLKGAEG